MTEFNNRKLDEVERANCSKLECVALGRGRDLRELWDLTRGILTVLRPLHLQ